MNKVVTDENIKQWEDEKAQIKIDVERMGLIIYELEHGKAAVGIDYPIKHTIQDPAFLNSVIVLFKMQIERYYDRLVELTELLKPFEVAK